MHFTHMPASKQDDMIDSIFSELKDATWELDPVTLTRALSSKMCKAGLHPLTIDEIDDLANYVIAIDKLEGSLGKASKAFKHEDLPDDLTELTKKEHYRPFISFLNACVETCRGICQKLFYERLKFIIYDTQMQDGILGASPLKPDGAGANGLSEGERKLWGRLQSGERKATLEIPIEVKRGWRMLIV